MEQLFGKAKKIENKEGEVFSEKPETLDSHDGPKGDIDDYFSFNERPKGERESVINKVIEGKRYFSFESKTKELFDENGLDFLEKYESYTDKRLVYNIFHKLKENVFNLTYDFGTKSYESSFPSSSTQVNLEEKIISKNTYSSSELEESVELSIYEYINYSLAKSIFSADFSLESFDYGDLSNFILELVGENKNIAFDSFQAYVEDILFSLNEVDQLKNDDSFLPQVNKQYIYFFDDYVSKKSNEGEIDVENRFSEIGKFEQNLEEIELECKKYEDFISKGVSIYDGAYYEELSFNRVDFEKVIFNNDLSKITIFIDVISSETSAVEDELSGFRFPYLLESMESFQYSPLFNILTRDVIVRYRSVINDFMTFHNENNINLNPPVMNPFFEKKEYEKKSFHEGIPYPENHDGVGNYRCKIEGETIYGIEISSDVVMFGNKLVKIVDLGVENIKQEEDTYDRSMGDGVFNEFKNEEIADDIEKDKLFDVSYYTKNSEILSLYAGDSVVEMIEKISSHLGVNLRNFTLGEQVIIVEFISQSNNETWHKLEYLSNFKENIDRHHLYKAFLSMDGGGSEMGQKILDLAEKLPSESANAIFSKYAELSGIAHDAESFIKSEFSEDLEGSEKISEELRKKMLSKGVDVLNIFHEKIEFVDINNAEGVTDLITDSLSKISADSLATLSTFKSARKSGLELSLEDIKNSTFEKKDAGLIEDDSLEEMIDIYRGNYAHAGDFGESLVEKFKEKFGQEGDTFYTFKIKDELQSFIRFTENEKGSYASALNVAQNAQGYSLGGAMMEQALIKESHENIIFAEADLNDFPIDSYLKLGFVVDAQYDVEGSEDIHAVKIAWDRELNKKLISKKKNIDEILIEKPDSVLIESYSAIKEFDRSRLKDFVITQKVFDAEKKLYTLVLERKPQ